MSSQQCSVNSNNTKTVQKFCNIVIKECCVQDLYEQIHQLMGQEHLTPEQHNLLDTIDSDNTQLLVQANQQSIKAGHHPWSPQLHEAHLVHHYWTLKLSTKRTGCNYPQAYAKIEAQIPQDKLKPPNLQTITTNLCNAQTKLCTIHKEAQDKQQKHLKDLITAANTCKDTHHKKLILCLKRAKKLKRCYSLVCSITKPKQQGGLSHVCIPIHNPSNKLHWESMIYDPQQFEHHVLQQHCKHFSQAHETVFTQEPLQSLINNECSSEYAQQILAGTAPIDNLNVNKYTKVLLHHLKSKTTPDEPTLLPLDPKALIQGFKKWPEHTSTSPSGRHLGIYKSLAKHFPPPKDETKDQPEDTHPIKSGNDILKLLIWMMELAVTHTHTYDQWKTIWTILLEKDTGNPQINCLRTIHLYKADYNLLLKWFSSKGFILSSKKVHCITNHQGGRCPRQA